MKARLARHYGTLCAFFLLAACAAPPGANPTATTQPTGSDRSSAVNATAIPALADLNSSRRNDSAVQPQVKSDDTQAQSGKDAHDTTPLAGEPLAATTPDIANFRQEGRASWYGGRFHGRRTANGERYDQTALTAAHRTLPLSAYVKVTNLVNHKSIVVRINDRGPYRGKRIIDLSLAAAKALDLQRSGVAKVELQGLSRQQASVALAEQVAMTR
jgi:rare lipoprotein A